MQRLGRREFLLGLGASSALAALRPIRLAAMRPPEASSPALQTVNVLIHGMFAVEVGTQEVFLYPPEVSGHVYKAGTLGAEELLAKGGKYQLSGLASHARLSLAEIHPSQVPVFHRRLLNTHLAHCEIVLPMPDEITPLRMMHGVSGAAFYQGKPQLYEQPTSIADVLVLTYRHVIGSVKLSSLAWAPAPKNGIANLHFWAMPEGVVPSDHAERAFAAMAAMIGYPHLRENPLYDRLPSPGVDSHPQIPGVSSRDEMGLAEIKMAQRGKSGKPTMYFGGSFTCAGAVLY